MKCYACGGNYEDVIETHKRLEAKIKELEKENLILKAHYCLDGMSKNIKSMMPLPPQPEVK